MTLTYKITTKNYLTLPNYLTCYMYQKFYDINTKLNLLGQVDRVSMFYKNVIPNSYNKITKQITLVRKKLSQI